MIAGVALLVAAASWLLTGVVRRYALRRAVLDVPNARSSHSVPTPRGGGAAIVVATLAGLAVLVAAGRVPVRLGIGLGVGGAIVAAIGWLDDHGAISARVRAAVQFAAGAWALAWLGGMPTLDYGAGTWHLGAAGAVLGLLGIVWATNLYNFMDGIDGLAGGEAVIVGGVASALLAARDPAVAPVSLLLACAAAGFLVWNWPPARVFMGDVGSSFLGFLFGALAAATETRGTMPALVWMLLLGVFVVDATVTVARRILRRERWYEAHREHAYQRAVRLGLPHLAVTGAALALDGLLAALAWAAVRVPAALPLCGAAALALLGAAYLAVERRRALGAADATPRG